jgi:hypothetical protein
MRRTKPWAPLEPMPCPPIWSADGGSNVMAGASASVPAPGSIFWVPWNCNQPNAVGSDEYWPAKVTLRHPCALPTWVPAGPSLPAPRPFSHAPSPRCRALPARRSQHFACFLVADSYVAGGEPGGGAGGWRVGGCGEAPVGRCCRKTTCSSRPSDWRCRGASCCAASKSAGEGE